MPGDGDKEPKKFDQSELDARSYQLGMTYAFAEMVGSGVKRLALSPPLSESELSDIEEEVKLIADEYHLSMYIDDDFLETRLFNPSFTRGRRSSILRGMKKQLRSTLS